jgi:hypothetical protein
MCRLLIEVLLKLEVDGNLADAFERSHAEIHSPHVQNNTHIDGIDQEMNGKS